LPARAWTDERAQAGCQLEQFLKLNYSADVLMPAPTGEKYPMFTHAGGSWSWARYDWSLDLTCGFESKDDGILLRDICVVDVYSVADADALEAQFPELRTAAN
jgi:hypothetical protein